MKPLLALFLSIYAFLPFCLAQSIELMPGHQRIFADVQWLKPLDSTYTWSVFSRARATVDYQGQSNLFLGTYVNYTTPIGLGGSLIGRISSNASGGDLGLHYLKANRQWLFFGLVALGYDTQQSLQYSWFSILRFRPVLSKQWKWYTSLELFYLFNNNGHVYSTERLRLGLDWQGWQFGLAGNLAQLGEAWLLDWNVGVFFRVEF